MVVSPLFSDAFLSSTANDPRELDVTCDGRGDLETGWACIETRGVFLPGGLLQPEQYGMVGAITAGPITQIEGGRLLWNKRKNDVATVR